MNEYAFRKIASMIIKSNMTIVLTGAGISTESGIPDFRSPESGLWEKIDPMEALSVDVMYNNPKRFYNKGFRILTSMRGAKPNDAHYSLKRMEDEGLIDCIITQNIDNLHYEAGSKNIMEVHGNIRTGHCTNCRKKYKMDDIEEKVSKGQIPPLCDCGGILRPDVVLFGDSLPQCFDTAWEKCEKCSLMIVIGSSLQVGPVNRLPGLVQKLVIINSGETMYDGKAEVVCRGKASAVLNNIYNNIQEIKNDGKL